MLHNTWLIAKREYVERIRAKSFIVMTVLIPTLMGGLTFAMNYATGKNKSDVNITIVTQDSRFGLDMQSELATHKHPKITADVISPQSDGADTRATLENQLKSKALDGYLWVTPPTSGHASPTFEWRSQSKGYLNTQNELGESVRTVLTQEGLAHSGMNAADVAALMQPIDLDSSAATKSDASEAAKGSALGLFFIMYFVILFYGMNVARSIIEEKTSRIFEVLLATIKPEEMMAGKVLGVGAVGLTQVGIWLIGALLLSARGLVAMGDDLSFNITVTQMIFFVVFFLLGYTLYSGMAAALGAMTSSEQELQQMNIFLMLPLIACSGVVFTVFTDPDGIVSKVFSFIPFCTPLIMYVRIAIHQPPWYEIAISLAGLIVTILAILWFAARVYRVGILMYGKKPNLPELLRWLKYS